MNKQELLDSLALKYDIVGTERQTADPRWYQVEVMDIVGDELKQGKVAFWVLNEGEANEAAYWHGAEPKPILPPPSGFSVDVQQYITDKINDGTIRLAVIESTDEARERAVGWAIVGNPGNFSKVNVVLFRLAGNITHEQYTG